MYTYTSLTHVMLCSMMISAYKSIHFTHPRNKVILLTYYLNIGMQYISSRCYKYRSRSGKEEKRMNIKFAVIISYSTDIHHLNIKDKDWDKKVKGIVQLGIVIKIT